MKTLRVVPNKRYKIPYLCCIIAVLIFCCNLTAHATSISIPGYNEEEWELFDLETDPFELRSLYGDPTYAEVQSDLLTELQRLRDQYRDDGTIRGKPDPPPKRS